MIDCTNSHPVSFSTKSSFSFAFLFLIFLGISCKTGDKSEPEAPLSSDPKVANLKLPAGFHADHLYGPSENEEGSWVSMAFDDKGRLIASDQYGALYRMHIPEIGDTVTKIKVEKLDMPTETGGAGDTARKKVSIGYAH